MADEIDYNKKIALLKHCVAKLKNQVQQLIRAAQQSAKAVNHLVSIAPRQMIRRYGCGTGNSAHDAKARAFHISRKTVSTTS